MRSRNGTTRQRQAVHKPLEATTTTMPARRMLKMGEMSMRLEDWRIGDGDRDETMDDEAVLEYEALMEKASMAYK